MIVGLVVLLCKCNLIRGEGSSNCTKGWNFSQVAVPIGPKNGRNMDSFWRRFWGSPTPSPCNFGGPSLSKMRAMSHSAQDKTSPETCLNFTSFYPLLTFCLLFTSLKSQLNPCFVGNLQPPLWKPELRPRRPATECKKIPRS